MKKILILLVLLLALTACSSAPDDAIYLENMMGYLITEKYETENETCTIFIHKLTVFQAYGDVMGVTCTPKDSGKDTRSSFFGGIVTDIESSVYKPTIELDSKSYFWMALGEEVAFSEGDHIILRCDENGTDCVLFSSEKE